VLKRALLDAQSVVCNKASTGPYLERLFDRLGVGVEVKAKAKETRYADGAAVIEHVIRGKGNEIGFGAITEIALIATRARSTSGRCRAAHRTTRPMWQRRRLPPPTAKAPRGS
jgi:hypothetical protein